MRTFPVDAYHPHYPDSAQDYFARLMLLSRVLTFALDQAPGNVPRETAACLAWSRQLAARLRSV
jgi:hypothetical protein